MISLRYRNLERCCSSHWYGLRQKTSHVDQYSLQTHTSAHSEGSSPQRHILVSGHSLTSLSGEWRLNWRRLPGRSLAGLGRVTDQLRNNTGSSCPCQPLDRTGPWWSETTIMTTMTNRQIKVYKCSFWCWQRNHPESKSWWFRENGLSFNKSNRPLVLPRAICNALVWYY